MILASASPRRKEILSRFTKDFQVVPANIKENNTFGNPIQLVCALSFEKAYSLWEKYPNKIIIGSDTVVALHGEVLGKPNSKKDAYEMLKKLSGKTHQVYTGYALLSYEKNIKVVNYSKCDVTFQHLEEELINRYLKYDEYKDKAGAYGIQGLAGIFVEKIHGDFETVVGFPIGAISLDLKKYFDIYLL
ncbi:MAG: nucleoside triphosphate pyrophosphatase [Tissierellia bacterium]|nr:nucleoside triphosphate pyrophosphatase [Tissierellia bacterium]